MVLIPGGEFSMGLEGEGSHGPVHQVEVDSFYMGKYEVTNAEYLKFCTETGRKLPEYWGMEIYHAGSDFPDYPVVGINWHDVTAFAEWVGMRLPTEAEWEFAARGGQTDWNYPYGDEHSEDAANFKSEGTVTVGAYAPNGYGLYDMSGNVWEWVNDYFDDAYYKNSPKSNPKGPEKGTFRVIRGGGWHSGPGCCRVYYRNALPSNWQDIAVGFRCVKDIR